MILIDYLANNLSIVINVVLGIVILILCYLMYKTHSKLKRFLVTFDSETVADSLESVSNDLSELKSFRAELESYLKNVEKRVRKSIRSVNTVRFNPWQGSGEGGSQSFATTFMNEEGDGVVISTLYSRDHVSVFGKSLKNKSSSHELSDEEKKSVEEAAKGL